MTLIQIRIGKSFVSYWSGLSICLFEQWLNIGQTSTQRHSHFIGLHVQIILTWRRWRKILSREIGFYRVRP